LPATFVIDKNAATKHPRSRSQRGDYSTTASLPTSQWIVPVASGTTSAPKSRYSDNPTRATLCDSPTAEAEHGSEDGSQTVVQVLVTFETPQRAITPVSSVFTMDDEMIGGASIAPAPLPENRFAQKGTPSHFGPYPQEEIS
jgi:hypothetical protein